MTRWWSSSDVHDRRGGGTVTAVGAAAASLGFIFMKTLGLILFEKNKMYNRRIKITKLPVEKPNTSGAAHLMCTGHQKVCIQIRHVHWQIGNGLTGVDLWTGGLINAEIRRNCKRIVMLSYQYHSTNGMGCRADLFDWIYAAKCITSMDTCHQLCLRA